MMNPNPHAKKRILLVDSDDVARKELRADLTAADLEFVEATTLAGALESTSDTHPDLVLSEIELSDGSGFALARTFRDDSPVNPTPIVLLLSRWSNESDRIIGFESGADDFVSRPFYPRELASRIRALLRRGPRLVEPRTRAPSPPGQPIAIDRDQQAVWVGQQSVQLTLRELSILTALLGNEGRVVSREELMAGGAGDDATSKRSVDAHVKGLRQKLGPARSCIETVRGRGYRYSGLARPSRRD